MRLNTLGPVKMVTIKNKKYAPDTKIEYQRPNPKRIGGMAYNRYEVYCVAKTLQEYLDICSQNGFDKYMQPDLSYDKGKGFLTIKE